MGGSFICLNVCIGCVEVIGLWGSIRSIDVLCFVYRVERGPKVPHHDAVTWRRDLDLGHAPMRGHTVPCFLRETVSCQSISKQMISLVFITKLYFNKKNFNTCNNCLLYCFCINLNSFLICFVSYIFILFAISVA